MRKVKRKKVIARGRFDFCLDFVFRMPAISIKNSSSLVPVFVRSVDPPKGSARAEIGPFLRQ